MKRFTSVVLFLLFPILLHGQAPPTVAPVTGNPDWSRTGNNAPPNGNVIGTFFPSPLYVYTQNAPRMKVNGNVTTTVNGFTQARDGYVGIGENSLNIWTNTPGPFSLLHLSGRNGPQQFGFRPWMQTGISFTSNDDFAYIGHKQNGPGLDITDLVIAWGDNAFGGFGPDMLKFVFSSGAGTGNNDLNGDHIDGREIMRLTGVGNVGIGPRFNNSATGQPQSQLHVNSEANAMVALQLTVQNQGQSAADGLRLTVDPATAVATVNQQERAHLLFSQSGGERMRITNVSTPGTPNPGGFTLGETRVGISHRANQLNAPLSLLHLGENAGAQFDGWRSWMDVGTFASQGSDHVYVGLKQRPPLGPTIPDRFDAAIAWGDNPNNPSAPLTGPDNLRFIFTTTTANAFDPLAQSADGREVMRLTPEGRVGIGDFNTTNPFGSATYVGARLDIDGDLRIRTLNQNNNLTRVLVADPGDLNRVFWRDASTLGGAGDPADDWIRSGSNMFPFALTDNVGVGTATPTSRLHVVQTLAAASGDLFALRVQNSGTVTNGHRIGLEVQNSGPMSGPRDDVGLWVRTVNGNPNPHANMAAVLDGNVAIGTLSVGNQEIGTQGRYVLSMRDGAAPITPVSAWNGVQLWSQSGELRVMDSSLNVTTLSPHNFNMFERSEPMAWSYYSENADLDRKVGVDMLRVVRVLEEISGEKLVHMATLNGDAADKGAEIPATSLRADLLSANERIRVLEHELGELRAMVTEARRD